MSAEMIFGLRLSAELYLCVQWRQSYKQMRKQLTLLVVVLLLAVRGNSQLAKCPSGSIQAISDSITVSSQGEIPIINGADIQCYNYTLINPFSCSPGVAIAVNTLESKYSPNLFFSVKTIGSDGRTVIPFVVRTHWGYTRWTKISFSFLAETSSQIEAGYYQIDTGSLSSCISGKSIVAFIPLTSQSTALSSAVTFLNGFEVSSISVNSSYLTPFQVQVVVNSVSKQGISILLSSTSATQVHSVFVSYIAYDPNIQNLVAGNYLYNKYAPSSTFSHTTPIGVGKNTVSIHGFNSFILRNNQADVSLKTSLLGSTFNFTLSSNAFYLAYNYFFFIGGPCGQCTGYSIPYNGNCVASCPPKSYFDGTTCVTCQSGQVWDGAKCVPIPKPNEPSAVVPSCPSATYWDQQQLRCLPCPNGCASCPSCYSCDSCVSGYTISKATSLCNEICGDGKRFTLPCDDGNAIDGDGCSSSCQIEAGFFCAGGSPNSKDTCSKTLPKAISFSSSGQSHQWGRIVLNIRVNYLPLTLIQSASDCSLNCRNVLSAKIISGDSSAVSIVGSYIPTTSYSFSVVIDFQREPIGIFSIRIGINPLLSAKYFNGVDISSSITLDVNPALLNLDSSALSGNNNIL